MKRYNKSHLIEAKYFLQDDKYHLSSKYSTNSHGKQIVSLSIKDKYSTEINFTSYKEAQAMLDLLRKTLRQTRGKWVYKKPSKDS